MKKRLKSVFKILVLFLAISIPFYVTPIARADSGWDSDYDSGGSWDSGSDWDSGSSWDSDYDYGSGGGSSSIDSGIELFIFFIIVVAVVLSSLSKNKRNTGSRSMSTSIANSYQDITLEQLTSVLPDLNLHILKNNVFDVFVQIQSAWMNFDYDKLRELCTDELYNSYVAQLETLKLKNGQNIMTDFSYNEIKITNIDEVNGDIILTVFMSVEFFDYVINTISKKVTRGNNHKKITNNYIMTFVMKADTDTKDDTKCPNCGAPIKHVTSGKCEYCNSTIVKKASKFVLSKKTNVNK